MHLTRYLLITHAQLHMTVQTSNGDQPVRLHMSSRNMLAAISQTSLKASQTSQDAHTYAISLHFMSGR